MDNLWISGRWFGTWLDYLSILIGNVIILIDFHIFQRGSNHQPVMDGCPNWSQTWKTASFSASFWRWHGWQDCHCKCASEYVRMGSIRGRVSCLNWAIWPLRPRFSLEGVALTCSRWMIIRSRCIINDIRHMLVQFTSRLDLDLQKESINQKDDKVGGVGLDGESPSSRMSPCMVNPAHKFSKATAPAGIATNMW